MGKRAINQALQSQKISKNNNACNKKQLNSLIKFLRPKVYITDSSNFKNLVQQLTGNETLISSPPPPDHQLFSSVKESNYPTQNLTPMDGMTQDNMSQIGNAYTTDEEQVCSLTESHQESISQELSVDSSEGSMPSSFTAHETSIQKPLLTRLDSNSKANQEMDYSAEYRKMESWLLEIESCSNYHYEGYVPLVQEQVSLCDYDPYLSSILQF